MQETVEVNVDDRKAEHHTYDIGYIDGHEDSTNGKHRNVNEYPAGLLDAPNIVEAGPDEIPQREQRDNLSKDIMEIVIHKSEESGDWWIDPKSVRHLGEISPTATLYVGSISPGALN